MEAMYKAVLLMKGEEYPIAIEYPVFALLENEHGLTRFFDEQYKRLIELLGCGIDKMLSEKLTPLPWVEINERWGLDKDDVFILSCSSEDEDPTADAADNIYK